MSLLPPPTRATSAWALFLDVDGTLVELAATPSEVVVTAGTRGLLDALAVDLGGALALVSGRGIDQLDALFDPLRLPTAGLHGGEWRRPGGDYETAAPAGVVAELLDQARSALAPWPGTLIEDKRLSIALHYRGAPKAEAAVRQLAADLVRRHPDFTAQDGKCVVEVKPAGFHKGVALERFLAQDPFRGRMPVYVGDDVTDEDGFRAARQAGGFGVLVGPARATLAEYACPDVPATLAWLRGLLEPAPAD